MVSKQSIIDAIGIYRELIRTSPLYVINTQPNSILELLVDELMLHVCLHEHQGEESLKYAINSEDPTALADYIFNHQSKVEEGEDGSVLEATLHSFTMSISDKVSEFVGDVRNRLVPEIEELYNGILEELEKLEPKTYGNFFKPFELIPVSFNRAQVLDCITANKEFTPNSPEEWSEITMHLPKDAEVLRESVMSSMTLLGMTNANGDIVEELVESYGKLWNQCPLAPKDYVNVTNLMRSVINYPHISTGYSAEQNVEIAKTILGFLGGDKQTSLCRNMLTEEQMGRLVCSVDNFIDLNPRSENKLTLSVYVDNIAKLGGDAHKYVLASTITRDPRLRYSVITLADLEGEENHNRDKLLNELANYTKAVNFSLSESTRDEQVRYLANLCKHDEVSEKVGAAVDASLLESIVGPALRDKSADIDDLAFKTAVGLIVTVHKNGHYLNMILNTVMSDRTSDPGMVGGRLIAGIISHFLGGQLWYEQLKG